MRIAVSAIVALICLPAAGAFAKDRPVTSEEQSKLEAALAAAGCSGGKMEFDDGKFEVDGAICADGKKYEIEFNASFIMIKKEADED